MKKIFISLIFIFVLSVKSYAFVPINGSHNVHASGIGMGLNYGRTNYVPNSPQVRNRLIINHSVPSRVIVTPPPPPPTRHTYKYVDFAGERRFPKRSYYIPSYCMPDTGFNTYIYNPFCNHYRPYGSNMYLSF